MIFRALDGICRSKQVDSVKLAKISRIVAMMREFETYAETRRGDDGRLVDERQLLREFASRRSIDTRPVDDGRVYKATISGVRWLLDHAHSDGGWGWSRTSRPTSLQASLPWDTAIAALALRDWLVFFQERAIGESAIEADDVTTAIGRAERWLIEHQSRQDGGWSRSGTASESSHAIDTGTVLWLFQSDERSSRHEVLSRALTFFDRLEHPTGGTRERVGSRLDVKATALSIMVRIINSYGMDVVRRNVAWLAAQSRSSDDHWFAPPEGQDIDPAFYAMSALLQYTWMTGDQSVVPVIRATVEGYLDRVRYVEDDRAEARASGWAWGDVANTAAAISALLNSGESPASPSVQMGLGWLLSRRGDKCWGAQTPIVMIALTRYLKPGSRLIARLQRMAKLRISEHGLATRSGGRE